MWTYLADFGWNATQNGGLNPKPYMLTCMGSVTVMQYSGRAIKFNNKDYGLLFSYTL
jgi:hypothetical protein